MFPRISLFAALSAALLSLPLAAAPAAAQLLTYRIAIADGVYTPQNIAVPAGQRFKIIVKNTGSGPAEFENLSLRVEKVLAAGVESFVVIHPMRPGKYHFIDEFHLNMAGFDIIVKDPNAPAAAAAANPVAAAPAANAGAAGGAEAAQPQ